MKHLTKSLHRLRNTGFTIVEVLIVVTIIVVLVGFAGFAATSYVKTSRDSSRESKATIIANALEKYYDQNGEYPSVALMTSPDTNLVKQKLSITDKDVLKFPLASDSTSNSITNGSASTTQLKYTANTIDQTTPGVATQCQSSAAGYCDVFTLSYVKESDKETVTIRSQNSSTDVNVVPSPPSKPTVSASYINNSLLRFSTTGATCAAGDTVEHKIRYNTSSASESSMPPWTDIPWTTSTTRDINPGSYVNFYIQSVARCINEFSKTSADSPVSNIVTYVKPTPPPMPTVTATAVPTSSQSITLTFSAATATSYSVSGPGTAANCKTSPCTVTGLSGGTYYTFNVTASNIAGTSPVGSASVTTTPAPATPGSVGAVSYYNQSGTATHWKWGAVTCNAGSPVYVYNLYAPYYNSWSGESETTSPEAVLNTSTQGAYYRLYVEPYCKNGTETSARKSATSTSDGISTDWLRPITNVFYAFGGELSVIKDASNSAPSSMWQRSTISSVWGQCPGGSAHEFQRRYGVEDNWNAWSGWIAWPLPTYDRNTNITETQHVEVSYKTRCRNVTTNAVYAPAGDGGTAGYGLPGYSDLWGNMNIPAGEHRNYNSDPRVRGNWRRGCGGSSPTYIDGNYVEFATCTEGTWTLGGW